MVGVRDLRGKLSQIYDGKGDDKSIPQFSGREENRQRSPVSVGSTPRERDLKIKNDLVPVY